MSTQGSPYTTTGGTLLEMCRHGTHSLVAHKQILGALYIFSTLAAQHAIIIMII